MVVDIITERLDAGSVEGEYAESLLPPPGQLNGEAYAMYWLLALAPYWRSCVYTFSDTLYRELLNMLAEKRRWMGRLLGVAYEIREEHPGELRVVELNGRSKVVLPTVKLGPLNRIRTAARESDRGGVPIFFVKGQRH